MRIVMSEQKSIIDLDALNAALRHDNPFPFTVIPHFLREEYREDLLRDFPEISSRGSYPLSQLKYGEAFGRLIDELEAPALRNAISRAFDIDLANRPTMITVRGATGTQDGHIHADTPSKLVTLLLYLNQEWDAAEGRLRILNNRHGLDDYVVEIPPTFGTCLIFKVTPNCWHGHKSFTGVRRTIQLNYVSDEAVLRRELSRHQVSAKLKSLTNWFRRN
jgi:SM-20-related protein